MHIKTYLERMAQPGQPAFPFSLAMPIPPGWTGILRWKNHDGRLRLTQEGVSALLSESALASRSSRCLAKKSTRWPAPAAGIR